MRSLLSFRCEGSLLGASLDGADGRTGVLIVTGGTQTRIGSHRLFERLAAGLAEAGYPVLRFDRRGIGDSEGEDPDFRGNSADIAAAVRLLRDRCPRLERIVGLGLCDGATSLAFFGQEAGLGGFVLINPWLVEAEAGSPPPAAIRHHYRQRLLTLGGWKMLLSGSVSYRKLLKGILSILKPDPPASLAAEAGAALAKAGVPVELILARHDATAVAAETVWKSSDFARAIGAVPVRTTMIESDAHTFSRPGDFEALHAACLCALGRLEASGSR